MDRFRVIIRKYLLRIRILAEKINTRLYFILVGIILLLLVYVFLRRLLLNSVEALQIIQSSIEIYRNSLLLLTEYLVKVFGIELRYFPDFNYLIYERGGIEIGYSYLALKQAFILFISMGLLEEGWRRKIAGGIFSLGLLYLINILRLSSIAIVNIDFNIIHTFYRSAIWLFILYYLLKRIEKHKTLEKPFHVVKSFMDEKTILNFKSLIILYFSRSFLILTYQAIFPKELLIKIILHQSAFFIKLFGADPLIDGRYIFIRRTWVYLGDACLGIMLILTYLSLFLVLKAKLINKFIWMLAGVIVIITINSVRIAAISLHLQNHGGEFNPTIDPHDLFSYMVYGAVFLIWVAFIKWGRGRV